MKKLALLVVVALAPGCASTGEPPPQPAQELPTGSAWSWEGCKEERMRLLLYRCPGSTLVSLARLKSDEAPDDEALYKVELDSIGGTVRALRPAREKDFERDVEKVRLGSGDDYVWHQRLRLPETADQKPLNVHALALPYQEGDAHYAVVYACVSPRTEDCLRALKKLLVDGPPEL